MVPNWSPGLLGMAPGWSLDEWEWFQTGLMGSAPDWDVLLDKVPKSPALLQLH